MQLVPIPDYYYAMVFWVSFDNSSFSTHLCLRHLVIESSTIWLIQTASQWEDDIVLFFCISLKWRRLQFSIRTTVQPSWPDHPDENWIFPSLLPARKAELHLSDVTKRRDKKFGSIEICHEFSVAIILLLMPILYKTIKSIGYYFFWKRNNNKNWQFPGSGSYTQDCFPPKPSSFVPHPESHINSSFNLWLPTEVQNSNWMNEYGGSLASH